MYFQLGRNDKTPLSDDDFLRAHWIVYFAYSRRKGDDYIHFLLNKFSAKNIFEKKTVAVTDDFLTFASDTDYDSDRECDIALRKPLAQNWYDVPVNGADYHLSYTVTRSKYLSLLIYAYNKEVFERLESKKSKIEEIFGDKLDWYSSREGSEAKRIIYKREADVFNPSKQEEYFAWMIDKCDELSNALVQVGEMDEEPQEKDKFSKLKQYLENCGKTELTLTFVDIEAIIGCTLCKSAYNYSAYWNPSPTHTMPNTILAAGFKVVSVDLVSKSLLLQKIIETSGKLSNL